MPTIAPPNVVTAMRYRRVDVVVVVDVDDDEDDDDREDVIR